MPNKLANVGFLAEEELAGCLPSAKRLTKGPVAVIECIQEIPCNPCEQACPFKAITVGTPITSLPVLDETKCLGCGVCIPQCPGLAIFVIDCSKPGDTGTLQIPYEYYPLPEIGEAVDAVDRAGVSVIKAVVNKVVTKDQTPVVTLTIPKECANTVRSFRRIRGEER